MAGAVRDVWVAGVGLDFVEEPTRHLLPGKVALLAEVEQDEDRMKRVQSSDHARGAKRSRAWSLTKEALAV